MNPARETTWSLKNSIGSSGLAELAGTDFQVEFEPQITSDMTVYDDFDAHLLSAGHILCRVDDRRFELIDGFDCVGEARASVRARFWWDFPDGKVKDELKSLIGLRAVLPVASLKVVMARFSLRNADEKIVARGQWLQSVLEDGDRHYLTLREMRGYGKSFAKARKMLEPVLEREVPAFGLKTLLDEQNPNLAGKGAVDPVRLAPDMPTEKAVRAMAAGMLDEALRHVDGVVADVDTVFLHRFRISVRKLRSLISLLKRSLPTETIEAVAPRLSAMAGRTGRLRDLDVFLLETDAYRAMLPATHEQGLGKLFALVGERRRQEKVRVARYFQSGQFRNDMAVCRAELSAAPVFRTPMSRKPVTETAKSLLIRRYAKIRRMSDRLDAQSVDEDVHDIRKEFKKFRYLIEFFDELLPRKRTASWLSQLKKIQSTLGQFNDYCVQIEFLGGFGDDSQIELTKALSGLIAVLHHHRSEARDRVESALACFFEEDMIAEIDLAFGSKAVEGSR